MHVRAARASDAEAFAEVVEAAFAGYLPRLPAGVRPAPMDADYAAAIARGEAWVAELGQPASPTPGQPNRSRRFDPQVAGILTLVAHPGHLLLETVAVHPRAQGHGVGRRLLQLTEERAATLRLPTIRLYTHATMVENQRLYERLGYTETSRGEDEGLDRVFYEKRTSVGWRATDLSLRFAAWRSWSPFPVYGRCAHRCSPATSGCSSRIC